LLVLTKTIIIKLPAMAPDTRAQSPLHSPERKACFVCC